MLALLAPSPAHAETEVISLRADHWCPYNCDPQQAQLGYMIDIAKAVFEPAIKVEFFETNWARALEETLKGRTSGVVGPAKSDASDLVYPDIPLGMSKICFYTRKDDKWEFTGLSSLESVKMGTVNGYSYGERLDAHIARYATDTQRIDMVAGNDALATNFKKMQKGRIRVLADDENVVRYTLSRDPSLAADVRKAGCDDADPVYIAFSPKNPRSTAWAKQLGDGLRKLRQSGQLATILGRYGLDDWEPAPSRR
jgi:polar amino acid transport system substrate-binding protein